VPKAAFYFSLLLIRKWFRHRKKKCHLPVHCKDQGNLHCTAGHDNAESPAMPSRRQCRPVAELVSEK
jgi:hypothetical protein